MRVRKVDQHFCLPGEEAVFTHFGPLVGREGAAELGGERAEFVREAGLWRIHEE